RYIASEPTVSANFYGCGIKLLMFYFFGGVLMVVIVNFHPFTKQRIVANFDAMQGVDRAVIIEKDIFTDDQFGIFVHKQTDITAKTYVAFYLHTLQLRIHLKIAEIAHFHVFAGLDIRVIAKRTQIFTL